MSAPGYYFFKDGEECGPVSEQEVIKLVRSGSLGPQSPLRKSGTQDWENASIVLGSPAPKSALTPSAPSALPLSALMPSASPAATFYRIDSTRVTLREYSSSAAFNILIAAVIKLLRIQVPSSSDDPCVSSLRPFEVSMDKLPPAVLSKMKMRSAELLELGFGDPAFHLIDDLVHNTRTYLATFRRRDGTAIARIHNGCFPILAIMTLEMATDLVALVAQRSQ